MHPHCTYNSSIFQFGMKYETVYEKTRIMKNKERKQAIKMMLTSNLEEYIRYMNNLVNSKKIHGELSR